MSLILRKNRENSKSVVSGGGFDSREISDLEDKGYGDYLKLFE